MSKGVLKRKKVKVEVGTLTITLPEHIIAAAIEMQIAKHLEENYDFKRMVEMAALDAVEDFKFKIQKAAADEVELIAPMHPNMQAVIESVRGHLDRYPLIGNDQAFQDYVGQKIFEWLQQKPPGR